MSDSAPATILVVDDSEDNRYAVMRHLEKAGFAVMQAESGEETLKLIESRPDLVVLDVDLPDMSGFEICHQIKASPETAVIPVLHLSATFTKTRHRVQGLEGGADAYLCHPVEPLELVATVHALLRLKRTEQALREANQRKDEFLAMLAHELRNPLAPLRNAVEVLRLRDADDPVARSAREIVDRQVAHMARLVDDLLDVTRIVRGKVSLHTRRCDLAQIVREVIEDSRAVAEANQLRLTAELPDQPVWVSGDPTRLAQVVGNLVHNALKFTDRGGETHLSLAPEGRSGVLLNVRDTGIGMDPAMIKDIFEPFSQADHSLERSRGGLGLGLALVKGLTELHGGRVEVASDGVGHGASFTVHLPIDTSVPPASEGRTAARPSPQPCRVLIIEDNLDAANSMRMLLGLLGHKVEVAVSGHEGVEKINSFRPIVVLCDIGLPGMDGYAVARVVRETPEIRDTYLVAVTVMANKKTASRLARRALTNT